jgi:hypothetical protein
VAKRRLQTPKTVLGWQPPFRSSVDPDITIELRGMPRPAQITYGAIAAQVSGVSDDEDSTVDMDITAAIVREDLEKLRTAALDPEVLCFMFSNCARNLKGYEVEEPVKDKPGEYRDRAIRTAEDLAEMAQHPSELLIVVEFVNEIQRLSGLTTGERGNSEGPSVGSLQAVSSDPKAPTNETATSKSESLKVGKSEQPEQSPSAEASPALPKTAKSTELPEGASSEPLPTADFLSPTLVKSLSADPMTTNGAGSSMQA